MAWRINRIGLLSKGQFVLGIVGSLEYQRGVRLFELTFVPKQNVALSARRQGFDLDNCGQRQFPWLTLFQVSIIIFFVARVPITSCNAL